MARKGAHVTTISVSERSIAFVRMSGDAARPKVLASGLVTGDWSFDDGSIQSALGDFVREHGLDSGGVYLLLPRRDVNTRIVRLPSTNLEEISGMVELTASEIVPYPSEEAVSGFSVLSSHPDGTATVLAAVVREDRLLRYLNVLEEAGVEVADVLLSTEALRTLLTAIAESGVAGWLHESSHGAELLVARNGVVTYNRAIPHSTPDHGDVARADELSVEVERALQSYRRESADGEDIDRLIVSTERGGSDTEARAISGRIGVTTEQADDLITRMVEGTGRGPAPADLAGACLLALSNVAGTVRLLPRRVHHRRAEAATRVKAVRLAAVFALVAAAFGGVYVQAVSQRRAYLAELIHRVDEVRPDASDVITKRRRLEFLRRQVERKDSVMEMLAAVAHYAPRDGVNITRFQYRHGEGIELNGRAVDYLRLDQFVDNLRAVSNVYPQFQRAQEMYRKDTTERGRLVWDYEIAVPFPQVVAAQ